MRKIGYARVSTLEQNLDVQRSALNLAGCAIVLEEKHTGTKREGRPQLALALQILTVGDVLVVTRLDRLGRSLRDLVNVVHEIEQRGAALLVTEQAVDTSTSAGRAFFGMLATFAAFETDIRRERQMEGIARARNERRPDGRRKYAGRIATISAEVIRAELEKKGGRKSDVARALNVSRMTVWRAIRKCGEAVARGEQPTS